MAAATGFIVVRRFQKSEICGSGQLDMSQYTSFTYHANKSNPTSKNSGSLIPPGLLSQWVHPPGLTIG